MTKLTPDHEAWRKRRASAHSLTPLSGRDINKAYLDARHCDFLAGMAAEHEAARLVGRIEAFIVMNTKRSVYAAEYDETQLKALLAGGKGGT